MCSFWDFLLNLKSWNNISVSIIFEKWNVATWPRSTSPPTTSTIIDPLNPSSIDHSIIPISINPRHSHPNLNPPTSKPTKNPNKTKWTSWSPKSHMDLPPLKNSMKIISSLKNSSSFSAKSTRTLNTSNKGSMERRRKFKEILKIFKNKSFFSSMISNYRSCHNSIRPTETSSTPIETWKTP